MASKAKMFIFILLAGILVNSMALTAVVPVDPDKCTDESNGSFRIQVEMPIQIEVSDDYMFAGEICPGCNYFYDQCDCPNIIYKVTGGSNCYFNYQSFINNELDGVGLSIIIYYFDVERNSWLRAKTNRTYTFDSDGVALLKACVHEIWADCTSDGGDYCFPLRISVQYTCGSI